MPENPDLDLARRDPVLPGLAEVLDPRAMAEALAEAKPDLAVKAAKALYVRYKPATNCLVSYLFTTAVGEATGYAKAVRAGAEAKIEKMVAAGANPVRSDLAISLFPTDRGLPALARFGHQPDLLLDRLTHPRPDSFRLRTLSYKPERRYVGALESNGRPEAVIRAYSPPDYPSGLRGVEAFGSTSGLYTPALAGKSDRHRALALCWMDGTPLRTLLHAPEWGVRLGEAFGHLHRGSAGQPLQTLCECPIVDRVRSTWRAVIRLLPESPPGAGGVIRRLLAEIDGWPRDAPLHGDLNADQVLVDPVDGSVGIIDWDHAGSGNALWDLGSFLADLERAVVDGHIDQERVTNWRSALLAGYETVVQPGALDRATAAAVVASAAEPFRRRQPNWHQTIERLLIRATELAWQ